MKIQKEKKQNISGGNQSAEESSKDVRREGIVVRNTGSSYIVRTDDGEEIPCRIKGNFRIKGIRTTNPVATGDRVVVSKSAEDADYITEILPRRNYIIRRASNLSKESHILASNIDLAMLVISLANPMTPTTFIDRFLSTAEAYNVPAGIAINKKDTWDEGDLELAEALRVLYTQIGYPVFFVSAATGEGVESIREQLQGKITLLAGNSGVGKSSLINALIPGAALRTGAISDIHHTGTHTTTFSEMLPLPGGGAVIDIPGVKGFGTIDFEEAEVSHYFPEIFRKSADCRYGNCKHIGEPGCAVVPAVENHEISQSRYASYLSILEELKDAEKYRKAY